VGSGARRDVLQERNGDGLLTVRSSTGDRIPTPEGVVCFDPESNPLPRISEADATLLVTRGWAQWIGKGTRRHLRLTAAAPVAAMPRGRMGTRRDRADQTCNVYTAGQAFGGRHLLEHIPLN
jgi:hypothetical protein